MPKADLERLPGFWKDMLLIDLGAPHVHPLGVYAGGFRGWGYMWPAKRPQAWLATCVEEGSAQRSGSPPRVRMAA